MNVFKHTIPAARDLEEEPLTEEEIQMLAEGYPPSTLGGLDHEEVVTHLAARLLDMQEERDSQFFEMNTREDDI